MGLEQRTGTRVVINELPKKHLLTQSTILSQTPSSEELLSRSAMLYIKGNTNNKRCLSLPGFTFKITHLPGPCPKSIIHKEVNYRGGSSYSSSPFTQMHSWVFKHPDSFSCWVVIYGGHLTAFPGLQDPTGTRALFAVS